MQNFFRGRFRMRSLLFVALAIGSSLFLSSARSQTSPPGSVVNAAAGTPYDQALSFLYEGRDYHKTKVRDYTCTMVKQERIRNKLSEENVILMKFRSSPFSVYMKWLAPKALSKQEVCFVWNKNNNKLRVHAPGLVALTGWHTVEPKDPKVMEQSRHAIYDAGMGKLTDRYIEEFEKQKRVSKSRIQIAEYDFQGRRCYRIDAAHTEHVPSAYAYRTILYLDKEWKLPLRAENYDWPRAGGPAEGELMEVFNYVDVRFNVGLTDNDFRY